MNLLAIYGPDEDDGEEEREEEPGEGDGDADEPSRPTTESRSQ